MTTISRILELRGTLDQASGRVMDDQSEVTVPFKLQIIQTDLGGDQQLLLCLIDRLRNAGLHVNNMTLLISGAGQRNSEFHVQLLRELAQRQISLTIRHSDEDVRRNH